MITWTYRNWVDLAKGDLDRWMRDKMADGERDTFEQRCGEHLELVLTGFWFAAKGAGVLSDEGPQ